MLARFIMPLILFFPLLVIQITVIPLIQLNGIVPNLIIILLVYYTVLNNQLFGTILGFIFGLLIDLITGSLIGSAMLSNTLTGFTAGYFSNENKRELYLNSFYFLLIIFLCAVIDSTVFSFFSSVELNTNIFVMFFEHGLLPGLYTSVLSIIVLLFRPKRKLL